MAHRNYLIIAGIAAATALAACSTTVTGSAEDAAPSAAIRFAAAPTKAAVTSEENMDAFAVWGWYRDDATTPVPVFDATPVTPSSSGQWTYDGTRYWLLGKTYNFTALHPADLPAGTTVEATADGSITIKGFDATATGEDAVDLMLATAKDITHADIDNIAPVGLKFEHLLARVNVLGAVMGGGQMHVEEITLSGIPKEGDYEKGLWTTSESTGVISGGEMLLNLTTGTDIFGDLLMIPQSVGIFTVELKYWENDETDDNLKTASFALPTGEVTEWEAGKSYRYTFTKDVAGNIVFMKPVVTEWNTATGGIITVE